MDYDSLLELVKNRRSIRKFRTDPVPDEHVDKIIEVARQAPSGYNTQPWEFIVVKKKELKESIMHFVNEYRRTHWEKMEQTRESWQKDRFLVKIDKLGGDWSKTPIFILVCGDTRTKAGLPMTVRYHQQKCESIYTSSLASAFVYMQLAATTLGLTTQWVTAVQVPLVNCMIKDLLGIPEAIEIYDLMLLGYAASKVRPKFLRAKEKMVHFDDCGPDDFRTDEEVKDFVRKTRSWIHATANRSVDNGSNGSEEEA